MPEAPDGDQNNPGPKTVDDYDIVVIGCGMAGVSAAISAREEGKSTVVLEKAPKEHRGGQTQHTAIIRFPTADVDLDLNFENPNYTRSDFYNDILDVTEGQADKALLETLVNNAAPTFLWMTDHLEEYDFQWRGRRGKDKGEFIGYEAPGARWDGDIGVVIRAAEDLGVDIKYRAEAKEFVTEGRRVTGVKALVDNSPVVFDADAVIIAAGGFESSTHKRTAYMGPNYDSITVRGVRYNTGDPIDMAIDIGANSDGNWSGAHTSMVNAGAPEVGSGVNSFHGYHYGVVLNHDGERFLDEGKDWRSKTYAKYGHEVVKQPYKEAFVILDAKTEEVAVPGEHGFDVRITADTLEDLITQLEIGDVKQAVETIKEYNEACDDEMEWNPRELDGKSTSGIDPEKTNWAVPLDEPPFAGYAVKPGMTFSFGGLAQSPNAEVLDTSDNPIPGLYVAGNSAGGLFYENYAGGTGQINAMVYGKIAGKQAAKK